MFRYSILPTCEGCQCIEVSGVVLACEIYTVRIMMLQWQGGIIKLRGIWPNLGLLGSQALRTTEVNSQQFVCSQPSGLLAGPLPRRVYTLKLIEACKHRDSAKVSMSFLDPFMRKLASARLNSVNRV